MTVFSECFFESNAGFATGHRLKVISSCYSSNLLSKNSTLRIHAEFIYNSILTISLHSIRFIKASFLFSPTFHSFVHYFLPDYFFVIQYNFINPQGQFWMR